MRTAIAAATFLACCGLAAAHPLGNFTTNRYAALMVEPRAVRIAYALDLAELPAYREMPHVDATATARPTPPERDAYTARKAAELAQHLELSEDGKQLALTPVATALETAPGAGGLSDAPPGRHVPRRRFPGPPARSRSPIATSPTARAGRRSSSRRPAARG